MTVHVIIILAVCDSFKHVDGIVRISRVRLGQGYSNNPLFDRLNIIISTVTLHLCSSKSDSAPWKHRSTSRKECITVRPNYRANGELASKYDVKPASGQRAVII